MTTGRINQISSTKNVCFFLWESRSKFVFVSFLFFFFFGFLSTHSACVCMFLREPPHVFVFCYRSRMTDRQTQRMRMGDRRVAGSTLPKFCFGFCVRRCGAKKSQIQKRRVLVERETTRSFFLLCRWRERTFFFPAEESGEKIGTRSFLLVNTHTLLSFFSEEDGMRVRFVFRFGAAEDTVVFYISLLSLQCEVVFGFSTPGVCLWHTHRAVTLACFWRTNTSRRRRPVVFFDVFFVRSQKKTTRRDTHTHHGEKKKNVSMFFSHRGCVCLLWCGSRLFLSLPHSLLP